jgi:hypothetical protein
MITLDSFQNNDDIHYVICSHFCSVLVEMQ